MPGPLAHVGNTTICPHGAPINAISTNTRVLVTGMPVTTMADTFLGSGCPFTILPAPGPMPCLRVQWLTPATRVLVNGQPALLQTSTGLCFNPQQAPNGPPSVVVNQTRVIAT